jgi:Zn-dependent peptidase ImmA (M78 family)
MSHRVIPRSQKIALARDAMRAAIDLRFQLGLGLEEPICPYSVAERLGVPVRFVDVSMEGFYSKSPLPRILLSSLRPCARKVFNCAHELGHHVFGHASTLDQLQEALTEYEDRTPEEFIVDSFAGHLLMPVIGIRRSFARRHVEPSAAQPHQILAIACEFGVGYATLATQLSISLGDITPARRHELIRARLALRRSIIPASESGNLAIVDSQFSAPTLDIEEEHFIVAPEGAAASNGCLIEIKHTFLGTLYKAVRRGIVELFIPDTSWTVSVRVTPKNFVGLARYRFLEDDE